jgi:DNA-binding transcriptional regulator YiaG
MAQRQPRTTTNSPIAAIRLAVGETQPEFAKRLGVATGTLKRWETTDRLPEGEAVLRQLRALAKKCDLDFPK